MHPLVKRTYNTYNSTRTHARACGAHTNYHNHNGDHVLPANKRYGEASDQHLSRAVAIN